MNGIDVLVLFCYFSYCFNFGRRLYFIAFNPDYVIECLLHISGLISSVVYWRGGAGREGYVIAWGGDQ